MATEAELETLVTKLAADVSNFAKGMKEAQDLTKKTAKEVEEHSKKIEGFTTSLKNHVAGAISALSALGISDFLGELLGKFQEAETGELKLRAALQANGREVESLMESYKGFAETMQDLTVLDSNAVLSLLRLAETYDVTGKSAERAAQNAIAFGAATDHSAESVIRLSVALEKGDFEMAKLAARSIPQLRGIKDATEFAAKAQQLLAVGFESARAEAASSAGQIKQLRNAYDNLKEDLGAVVAQGIAPVVKMAKEAVKWFAGLSKETKSLIVIVLGLTTVVLGLAAAFALAGVIFNTMFAGAGIIIGVIVTALAGLAGWTVAMGGVEKAWKKLERGVERFWAFIKPVLPALAVMFGPVTAAIFLLITYWDEVKQAASEFFEFVKPVAQALVSLLGEGFKQWKDIAIAVFSIVMLHFENMWKFAKFVWRSITGDAEINWKKIRDNIRDSIIFIEFAMNNFGALSELVFVKAALTFTYFSDKVIHFFKETMPAALRHFLSIWGDIFEAVAAVGVKAVEAVIKLLVNSIDKLPELIADPKKLADLFKEGLSNFKEEATKVLKSLPAFVPPVRETSESEKNLAMWAKQLEEQLAKGFDAFLQKKLKDFDFEPDLFIDLGEAIAAGVAGQKAGFEFGEGFNLGVKDSGALKKLDAALFNSAEGLARMRAFREQQMDFKNEQQLTMKPQMVVQSQPAPPNKAELDMVELLKTIAGLVAQEVAKPPIQTIPASID